MDRRSFLKSSTIIPLMAYMPLGWSQVGSDLDKNTLILVQLRGGNDALNTFIPYNNPDYYVARPNIAIQQDDAIILNDNVALHPSLSPLLPTWQNNELAIVHGLGYPKPNRSHFRGIEIWQTASNADEYLSNGWLNEIVENSDELIEAIALSGSSMSTYGATKQFNLAGQTDLSRFNPIYIPSASTDNALLNYIMSSRAQFNNSLSVLDSLMSKEVSFNVEFPKSAFGQQCYLLAKLMVQGFIPKVWHLGLGSFDTHNNQPVFHSQLLRDLAESLSALREALIEVGQWSSTTVASYCEFGRRVNENGSLGTDHGTAASHFVMGGNVNGGEHGTIPSLSDLDNGDLFFNADFRSYYKALLSKTSFLPPEQLNGFDEFSF